MNAQQRPSGLLDPRVMGKFSGLYLVAKTVVEGFISGLHKSLYRGFSIEFAGHREYTAGDDLRYLDWKVFGRTDRTYVRVFREETNVKTHILLDISRSMEYTSGSITKKQYGIWLAACLSYLMISQKDAVGLILLDSDIRRQIKPGSTTVHLHHLLSQLENLPLGKTTSLAAVLHRIALNIKRRSLIILISDLFDEPDKVINGLVHFRHHHHEVIVFQILDAAELDFSFSGHFQFVDMESGEKMDGDSLALSAGYRQAVQSFLRHYQRQCSANNISYARAVTETPFDYFLYQYLNLRARTV
ncbi:MAG: DUF58 domain-containing protein [Candidatus Omnitrophica bacterium]|nr:DUF58 domain-containing protein [Candidatus Omnitrophota bacterium]